MIWYLHTNYSRPIFVCEFWCVYHKCLGSWRAEWCWLQSPPLSCHMIRVLKIFLQRPTIALLLHRISHVAQCVYILTKALLLFTLLLKMSYVELMVGEKRKHALVSHVLRNQTKDPWRWQIKQADQDLAHMWKVDGGNGILLLWISLPFIWITWGHGYINIYIPFFFLDLHVSNFFLNTGTFMCPFFLGHASWACHLFSLFFYIAHASFERY